MYSVCGCIVHLVDSPEDCFLSVTWLYCCSAVLKLADILSVVAPGQPGVVLASH